MGNFIFKELKLKEDFLHAFPIMQQLRSHLNEKEYLHLVKEAQDKDSYQMAALLEDNIIVAVVGFKPMITLYYGKFVWISDLVTDETRRSRGYGKKLLTYVESWAKERGYYTIALSSGLQRMEAHHFYEEKMQYEKVSYVFKKVLDTHEKRS